MTELLRLYVDRIATPVGELFVVVDAEGRARAIDWTSDEARMLHRLRRHYGDSVRLEAARDPGGVCAALREYFDGALDSLDRVRVETGGTPFQRAVWRALRQIPCGATISYGELARRIDRPNAFRAVGLANNANPIAIVVPCHRVIGSDGSLTGYGGGLAHKRWLLEHESAANRSAELR